MPDEPQATLAEVIDLLDRVGARLDALTGTPPDGAAVLAETGAMHRTRASHAQQRTQEMREGLEEVRRRAEAVAADMRDRRDRRDRRTRDDEAPGPVATWWDAVTAAADRLLDARLEDPDDVRHRLLEAAGSAVPAAAGAGLVWCGDGGVFEALHRDDPVLDALAEHVRRSRGGPATAALAEGVVHVPDLRHDRRWPGLAADAERVGAVSLLAVRLTVAGQDRGRDRGPHVAAVFHAPRPHAFGVTAVTAGRLFARQAAILLLGSRRAAGLLRALDSRDVIGQAKGVLVARDGISPDEAFARLTEASQSTNVKLRDVAAWLVDQTWRPTTE
ncbi:hypothetical protein GCM10023201_59460 [Actinomycetospora corticicola]